MSKITIVPGNTVRCTVTFEPEQAIVINVANVTARCFDQANRVSYNLTVVDDPADNVFHADVQVPDPVPVGGTWRFRFETNSPAPHISLEGDDMAFDVAASRQPNP